jgi:hypothetical protein
LIAVPRLHERRRRDDAGEGCQRERVLQHHGQAPIDITGCDRVWVRHRQISQ